MRVVFLGTPEFAVPSLEILFNHSNQLCEVVGIITQPDRPAGRGHKLRPSPVKVVAEKHGVAVFQPKKIRSNPAVFDFLKDKHPDLIVVVAFGQILPIEFIDFPSLGTLNVHASLLPKYRGASPIVHVLLNGERETGVTIMKVDEGIDTGDILSQMVVPVSDNMTAGELEEVLAVQGSQLLLETLPGYVEREMALSPQDNGKSSYAPRISKDDAEIDWAQSAEIVHNRIRAFNPWPLAFTGFRGDKLKIWCSRKIDCPDRIWRNSGNLGRVVAVDGAEIITQCGQGTFLSVNELQMPNRKRISAGDFVNGVRLKVGESFA